MASKALLADLFKEAMYLPDIGIYDDEAVDTYQGEEQENARLRPLMLATVILLQALDDGTYNGVRESLALMAEGEGPDPETYRKMALAALKRLDAGLLTIRQALKEMKP